MSNPVDFSYQGTSYDLDLSQKERSDYAVKINDITYSISGDKDKLPIAYKILSSVTSHSVSTDKDLQKRLSVVKDISSPSSEKVKDIGKKELISEKSPILSIEKPIAVEVHEPILPKIHTWKEREDALLPKRRELLAKAYWAVRNEKGDHGGLKEFLGPKHSVAFDKAMQTDNFEEFLALFDDFSTEEIRNTYMAERLGYPLGIVKTQPYTITKEDRENLKRYLDDSGFSGVVYLSDATSTYCISPSKLETLETVPFSMHSIGKVFTGALALMTMPSKAFGSKLSLEPAITHQLPVSVQEHLSKPTLYQAMKHIGGFGDFLGNYQHAIEEALLNHQPLPVITKPEDFLKFTESAIFPLDQPHYSNLGILLVSLALQKNYQKNIKAKIKKCEKRIRALINKSKQIGKGHSERVKKAALRKKIQMHKKQLEKLKSQSHISFDQILEKHILKPAKIKISSIRPDEGVFNIDDSCQGNTVGCPAGGYWITPRDLHQFGIFLHNKCKSDPEFLDSIEKYGSEFYVPEDREIHHNGNSGSGSAFLSSFLDSGISISILSDQTNFKADTIYYAIRENLVEQQ